MSDTKLKVGDVCREPLALKVGMRVLAFGDDVLLRVRRSNHGPMGWDAAGDGCGHWIGDAAILHFGVVVLALPEEAPPLDVARGDLRPSVTSPSFDLNIGATISAHSLESVPVGSRWRRNGSIVQSPFTVVARDANGRFTVHYDDDQRANTFNYSLSEILAHATRIDEPAGSGKIVPAGKLDPRLCGSEWRDGNITYRCTRRPHDDDKHRNFSSDLAALDAKKPAAPVAMPPARCAPGCTPSKSCRITIPVTDKGTRYECPAFREPVGVSIGEAINWAAQVNADQAEARAMRGQRWEARTPMVGRYRFNRR